MLQIAPKLAGYSVKAIVMTMVQYALRQSRPSAHLEKFYDGLRLLVGNQNDALQILLGVQAMCVRCEKISGTRRPRTIGTSE
jgi:hypothetical protein